MLLALNSTEAVEWDELQVKVKQRRSPYCTDPSSDAFLFVPGKGIGLSSSN
jgi:hypothetical protein